MAFFVALAVGTAAPMAVEATGTVAASAPAALVQQQTALVETSAQFRWWGFWWWRWPVRTAAVVRAVPALKPVIQRLKKMTKSAKASVVAAAKVRARSVHA